MSHATTATATKSPAQQEAYKPKNKVRMVTAASLFDGHDAAINIMRRIIQATGVEVIHLGHDRSVEEVVNTAIQEDVQAIGPAAMAHRLDRVIEGMTGRDLAARLIKDVPVV